MKADLHIHSNISDGSDSIEQIIDTAKVRGLDAIAITDHDTLSHLSKIPNDAGIMVIGGVEISAIHLSSGIKAHIIAYKIKKPVLLTTLTRTTSIARNRNSEKQIEILRKNNYFIDNEKIARADGKCIYKQHIMDWLVSTGQVPDMFGDFYQRTFKNGGVCDFDICYPDVFEVVRLIKRAGGYAVLAHPGWQQNFWLIPDLVNEGLDGLELNHRTNTENDKSIIRDYAVQYGLFLTGGSDYHGKYEPHTFGIGDILSDESGLRAIC
jgi:hypothetical protein